MYIYICTIILDTYVHIQYVRTYVSVNVLHTHCACTTYVFIACTSYTCILYLDLLKAFRNFRNSVFLVN